jgi:AraC-like DNA-binding protein
VIKRLNRDFALPLRIDELAEEARMSASSLYDVLLTETTGAAEAAFQVGYESPSHFSREYARMFGLPPVRDIRRLRDTLLTGGGIS